VGSILVGAGAITMYGIPLLSYIARLVIPKWSWSAVSVRDGATSYLLSHVSTRWSRNDVDVDVT